MDIGAKLREARESKGMTLEDVQQRTKIQKRYLKAIEENNHSVMPGEFYTRAFIKEYAQTVGLDPDEVLESKEQQQEAAVPPVQEERKEAPSRQERGRAQENDRPPRRERKGIPYLSSIIIGLIVVAAIVVGVLIYAGGSNDNNQDNSAQQNEDQVNSPENDQTDQGTTEDTTDQSAESEEQANDAAEEEQAQQEEEQAEPTLSVDEEGTAGNPVTTYTLENAGDEVTLTLAAEDGDAWLQVGDGNSAGNVYTGTISAGSEPVEQDVSDLETVSIKTGFARATKLEINGQELTFPIDNDVQTITVNIQK